MSNLKSKGHAEVGIIVVNFNGGDMLLRCIDSVTRQNYDNFLVLIVDNGSTDDSIANVRNRFPGVQIIETGRNLGFAAANNTAFRILNKRVRWFALVNPDAYPSPCWLSAMMSATVKHKEYDAFGSKCYADMNYMRIDGVGDEYHISGLVWRKGYGMPDNISYGTEREIFSPCAAAALYSQRVIEETGGFDEDFFCYIEDIDLGFRLRLLGYKCMFVPDAVVIHESSGIAGTGSAFQIYHGHRNIVWTFFKNMPLPLFFIFLPIHILMNLFAVIIYMISGDLGIIMRAKFDAVAGLVNVAKKRPAIHSQRRVGILELLRIFSWALRGRSVWREGGSALFACYRHRRY